MPIVPFSPIGFIILAIFVVGIALIILDVRRDLVCAIRMAACGSVMHAMV